MKPVVRRSNFLPVCRLERSKLSVRRCNLANVETLSSSDTGIGTMVYTWNRLKNEILSNTEGEKHGKQSTPRHFIDAKQARR